MDSGNDTNSIIVETSLDSKIAGGPESCQNSSPPVSPVASSDHKGSYPHEPENSGIPSASRNEQINLGDLMKTLECPVCLDILVPPVFNCYSGHIICSICRPRIDRCALCGNHYTTIRNYPIESILSFVDARCRHSMCSTEMKADKLREHLTTCEYRPIPCYEYTTAKCYGRLINFEDFPKHLMEVHKIRCKTSNDPEFQRINLSNALEVKWPVFLLSHRNQTFFLHRKSVFQHLLCWVLMMTSEKEAEKYSFQLKIRHPVYSEKSMEWNIRARSIHVSLDKVKEAGDCVFIPYQALIPYCERKVRHTTGQVFEFKWTMMIRINNLNEDEGNPSVFDDFQEFACGSKTEPMD